MEPGQNRSRVVDMPPKHGTCDETDTGHVHTAGTGATHKDKEHQLAKKLWKNHEPVSARDKCMRSRGKKADGQDRTPYTNDKRMKQRKLGLRGKGKGILGDQLKTQMDAAELPTSVLAGTENPADPNYVPAEEQQRDLVAKMEAAKLEEQQAAEQGEEQEYDEQQDEEFDQEEEYDENEEYQDDESEQQRQPAENIETKATQKPAAENQPALQSKPVKEETGEYQCITAEQQKQLDKTQEQQEKGSPHADPNKPVKAELQIGTNPNPSPGESASKTAGSRFSAPPDPNAPHQGPTLDRA